MTNYKIMETEVIDNTVTNEDGQVQVSEISVLVEIEIDKKEYYLDFQTTTTQDYGAYSSDLAAYDGTDSYDEIAEMFDDDEDLFQFLDEIKEKSNAQELWNDFVKEDYIVNNDNFGGIDANSEINEATKL